MPTKQNPLKNLGKLLTQQLTDADKILRQVIKSKLPPKQWLQLF